MHWLQSLERNSRGARKLSSPEERKKKLQEICEEFVARNAPQEINICSDLRDQLLEKQVISEPSLLDE